MAPTSIAQQLKRMETALEITNTLLEAVSTPDPVPALASRMSTICHGTAAIYDFEGNIIANSGEAPLNLIWNEISATHQSELTLEIGRWSVRTRRVSLRERIHVIALASRSEQRLDEVGDLLMDTSERLLGAVHGIQYGATWRDRRDNEQLLASLHDGVLPAREHRYWNRLTQLRFPPYSPVRTIEFAAHSGNAVTENQLSRLVASARDYDAPLVAMIRQVDVDAPATIAGLIPAIPSSEQWLKTASARLLTGVSAPFAALANTPASVREAETALAIAQQWAEVSPNPDDIGPVMIDKIDLTTWLLSHVDQRQAAERITRTLARLGSGQLRSTLTAYLALNQNVAATAEALFVHTNTVRYRLSKIEEAIGSPLASALTLTNLTLALHPELIARASEFGASSEWTNSIEEDHDH